MAYITLSRSAFFHNLELLCKKAGGKENLFIVLKDNAYGHGLAQMAKLSSEFGLECAVVRNYEEASQISGLFKDIIILNPVAPHKQSKNYSIVINDIATLCELKPNTSIHLKIDTGMHRNGLYPNEIFDAINKIEENSLHLKAVMTHYRSADELGSELFWQLKVWEQVKEKIKRVLKKRKSPLPIFHSANSAALLRLKNLKGESARCGIGAYGYHELNPLFGEFDLLPVLKLYARRISTKELKKAQRIGYGGTFQTNSKTTVSTYDIGYGDGLFRYNGKGDFYLGGKKVLGKISMDSICFEGKKDEVLILDDAKKVARFFDTISYDILVKLSSSIQRVIVD